MHVGYIGALVRAYHHGDFSLAYPLARGGGALVAAVGGVVFLSDELSGLEWLAIAIIVGGLASLVRPGASRVALLWAGLTAACIGTYTTLDIEGARKLQRVRLRQRTDHRRGDRARASPAAPPGGVRRSPALSARNWPRYSFGGLLTTTAYSMVLAAGRLAPAGYVASLRESSVVIAAARGLGAAPRAAGAGPARSRRR